jgi:hypothetical protein
MTVRDAIHIFKSHRKISIGRGPQTAIVTFLNISKNIFLIIM